MHNPYLDLTEQFNAGSLRTLLSSGQAVVVHRLAIMSKDGDWIIREDQAALDHVLDVLTAHGAHARFGAPLDLRWLRGGWSSHFEFMRDGLRLRTDFVSRPPRLSPVELDAAWASARSTGSPVIGLVPLAAIKLTNREKDYAVVGDLARRMARPEDQLRFSRSARDLLALADAHPDLVPSAIAVRPALAAILSGRDALEEALDRERRALMRANEARLQRYQDAARPWAAAWSNAQRRTAGLPLREAHAEFVKLAEGVLPFAPARPLTGDRGEDHA